MQIGGQNATVAIELRKTAAYLVQVLDQSPQSIARLREAISAADIYGPVAARTFDGGHLPYVDQLVNLLVICQSHEVASEELLRVFWESHDPTQGMRQGNDTGSQYRSVVYTVDDSQLETAESSRKTYGEQLDKAGYAAITTEIMALDSFHYAEDYHQQYLAKNPAGYCGIGGTGVSCAI